MLQERRSRFPQETRDDRGRRAGHVTNGRLTSYAGEVERREQAYSQGARCKAIAETPRQVDKARKTASTIAGEQRHESIRNKARDKE